MPCTAPHFGLQMTQRAGHESEDVRSDLETDAMLWPLLRSAPSKVTAGASPGQSPACS